MVVDFGFAGSDFPAVVARIERLVFPLELVVVWFLMVEPVINLVVPVVVEVDFYRLPYLNSS